LLGYSITGAGTILQIADLVGIYGATFFISTTNSMIYFILTQLACAWRIKSRKKTDESPGIPAGKAVRARSILPPALALMVMWTSAYLYGVSRIEHWERREKAADSSGVIGVKVVQGSFGVRDRWNNATFDERLETYIRLSEPRKFEGRAHMVVWPETVLNSPGRLDKALLSRLSALPGTGGLFLAGGVRKSADGRIYNTMWCLSPAGGLSPRGDVSIAWYDKNMLLPFAETNPLDKAVLGGFYEAPPRFHEGRTPPAVHTILGKVGASICFESLYSEFVRDSVKRGAEVLVNLSNDSWFGNTVEPYQHLQAAVMRAVENRRFLVRASNSGISAVISPAGRIMARGELDERKAVDGAIRLLRENTVYSVTGYCAVYFALFVTLAAFAMRFRKP
jgi:apolipoprotein N-acyltransferase